METDNRRQVICDPDQMTDAENERRSLFYADLLDTPGHVLCLLLSSSAL